MMTIRISCSIFFSPIHDLKSKPKKKEIFYFSQTEKERNRREKIKTSWLFCFLFLCSTADNETCWIRLIRKNLKIINFSTWILFRSFFYACIVSISKSICWSSRWNESRSSSTRESEEWWLQTTWKWWNFICKICWIFFSHHPSNMHDDNT